MTLIAIVLIIVVFLAIVVCRLLARAIREINRYDAGLPPRKGRKL